LEGQHLSEEEVHETVELCMVSCGFDFQMPWYDTMSNVNSLIMCQKCDDPVLHKLEPEGHKLTGNKMKSDDKSVRSSDTMTLSENYYSCLSEEDDDESIVDTMLVNVVLGNHAVELPKRRKVQNRREKPKPKKQQQHQGRTRFGDKCVTKTYKKKPQISPRPRYKPYGGRQWYAAPSVPKVTVERVRMEKLFYLVLQSLRGKQELTLHEVACCTSVEAADFTRDTWLADSGASCHMGNSDDGMFNIQHHRY
jgi:hypothetical protein